MQQFALHLHAHMQARLGEFDGALEAMGEYRRGLRELGKEREYAVTAGCVWDVCSWSGDWEHGEAALRESYEQFERTGNKALLSNAALDLADAAVGKGRLDEAERLYGVGEELSASDELQPDTQLALLHARLALARGDLAAAEAAARQGRGRRPRNRLSSSGQPMRGSSSPRSTARVARRRSSPPWRRRSASTRRRATWSAPKRARAFLEAE